MLKNIASVAVIGVLVLSGCSSYPSDPKGVAEGACNAFKALDFDKMKSYTVKSQHADIDRAAKQFEKMKNAPKEQQAMVAMAMGMIKSMKCDAPEMITVDATHADAKFAKPLGKMHLEKISGMWKVSK